MNAIWKYGTFLLTVAALVMCAWLVPAGAEEDEDGGFSLEAVATELDAKRAIDQGSRLAARL